ncbi:hypothetical protein [Nocardioides aurantiacus]|uniref:Uncharacterized protein n=1 Tax=Nocardioides aurantiacus TaxID=86796 RepID=A0A3N2CQC2_9ACTN|nr:hypothetical protein [Nocardioides aurantiacus]ROR89725.1 hypothetical protein EDD33_0554 [Nocardioides aurantiacus]
MSRRAAAVALSLALCLTAAGCQRGQDDELEPRPTRTVTTTPSPTLQPPATVPLGGASGFTDDGLVWAQGSELHVGGRTLDLAPVTVEGLVATPDGAYVLARGELWSVDLRRAEGTTLPGVERVGLSRDGRRLLVDLRGDTRRRAYDLATGRLVPGPAPAALTARARAAGPGEYAVTSAADGTPRVTGPDGTEVTVPDLPERFVPEAWSTPTTVAGRATAADGATSHVSCRLDGAARCTTLGDPEADEPVVLAVAALPG